MLQPFAAAFYFRAFDCYYIIVFIEFHSPNFQVWFASNVHSMVNIYVLVLKTSTLSIMETSSISFPQPVQHPHPHLKQQPHQRPIIPTQHP